MATADLVPKYSDAFDTLIKKSARTPPGKAESDPVVFVIALASQELMRRPYDFKTQEIKDICWSLSRVRSLSDEYISLDFNDSLISSSPPLVC